MTKVPFSALPAHSSSVLITGVSGSLGSTLARHLAPRAARLTGIYHRHASASASPDDLCLDLTDGVRLAEEFRRVRPQVVLHTAAATDADWCEDHPAEAWDINVKATEKLAELSAEARSRLIYFSTDLVFDGTGAPYAEDDPARPLGHYGRTKLAAEKAVGGLGELGLTLRVSLLYGWGRSRRGTFLDSLAGRLARGETVTLFTDQYRTPVWLEDVARVAAGLVSQRAAGLYHVAGSERLSRYAFGQSVCRAFGFSCTLLREGSQGDHAFRSARPVDCSLSNDKLRDRWGMSFTPVAAALAELRRAWSPPAGGHAGNL